MILIHISCHSFDCSAMISLFASQKKLLLFLVVCVLLHLHLVSCGLFLDLLVDFFILQWSSSGYKYWIGPPMCYFGVRSLTPRMTLFLPLYGSSTIMFPILLCFSLHLWLGPHLLLLSLSPLCYVSYCDFLKGITNTIVSIFSMLPLCTCWYSFGVFLILEYFHLAALLKSL